MAVIAADLSVVGYTVGIDVSASSIEDENPLYVPQAKIFDGSCAIGPAIVPVQSVGWPLDIRLEVRRGASIIHDARMSTARMRRPILELVAYLGRALEFPVGGLLFTGTGVALPDTPLQPADVVRVTITSLGTLETVVEPVGSISL